MFKKLIAPDTEVEIKKHWKYTDKVYVSILCPCFNQEDYIRDTIESFLAQESEYRFEIIVHDDASSDSTAQILKSYQARFPTIVKLILQTENQYSQGKLIFVLAANYAQGEFLALCEGDDYWLDPKKIQKQVVCLLSDQSISLVHTGALDFIQNTNNYSVSVVPSSINTTSSLFNRNQIRTLTTMFPKKFFDEFFTINYNEATKWLLGDWPLWIYLSVQGKIVLIPDVTSVYRILSDSASHFTCKLKKERFVNSTLNMRLYMYEKYCRSPSVLNQIYESYAKDCLVNGIDYPKMHIDKLGLQYRVFLFLDKLGITSAVLKFRTRMRRFLSAC